MLVPTLLIVVYSIWAIYTGFAIVSGRSVWLDSPTAVSIIVKIILSIIVGYFIAGFYLMYLIFRIVLAILR